MGSGNQDDPLTASAQLRERSRELLRHSAALRERHASAAARAKESVRRREATAQEITEAMAESALLDDLETVIRTARTLPAGSDGKLVVIDQMHDLVVRYQLQELGLSSEDVEDMWRGMGLDLPLKRVPSAES
jgi:hypothetical protein